LEEDLLIDKPVRHSILAEEDDAEFDQFNASNNERAPINLTSKNNMSH
jgi:hypothetical protein